MERIWKELESINKRESNIIMLITELAAAITALDTTVNQIAAAIGTAPSGSVPQPAVDALTKLQADLATLSALVTPTAVPSAPTGLTATPGAAQVSLSWNAVTGATGYNVKASTTSGAEASITPTPLTSTTFTDTTAKTGVQVFYVVTAVNSAGESANSTEVSATPA